jgi:hypothetical protein
MEIFKDIEGYEGVYQVSNLGNVKSYKNKNGKILSPNINSKGYAMVGLMCNTQKNCTIHRLVAEAFLSNPEKKSQVNHINGNKTDNRLENLEWVTPSENRIHAYKTGLQKGHEKRGKDSPLSMPVVQLTLDNIIIKDYAGVRDAGRKLGIDSSSISKCCRGEKKTHYGFKWQYKI